MASRFMRYPPYRPKACLENGTRTSEITAGAPLSRCNRRPGLVTSWHGPSDHLLSPLEQDDHIGARGHRVPALRNEAVLGAHGPGSAAPVVAGAGVLATVDPEAVLECDGLRAARTPRSVLGLPPPADA